jgi:hypothetical protein
MAPAKNANVDLSLESQGSLPPSFRATANAQAWEMRYIGVMKIAPRHPKKAANEIKKTS